MRWWQLRPIEFALLLFPIIIQRALVLPLYIVAATYADPDGISMSFAMDATYAGIHAPDSLKQIITLGWVLLVLAAVSASIDRCYKWYKLIIVFAVLIGLMVMMNLNAAWVYEPYLAVRR